MTISAKRDDIQHLRALAVFAVVLFHVNSSLLPNGYLGVDYFFAISGFVVWPLISSCVSESGKMDWKQLKMFFRRRIYRLLPALGFVLGCFTVVTLLFGMLEDHRHIAAQGIAAMLILGNLEAYSQSQGSYFHPNPNPLLHTWSLSAEEQVYLAVATTLIISTLIFKRKPKFLMAYLGIFSAGVALIIYAFQVQTSGALFYSPLSRIWEFSLGAIASLSQKNKKNRFTPIRLMSLTFSLAMLLFPADFGLIGQIVGTCCIAVYLAVGGFAITGERIKQILDWVGDRSYSIYLLHLPVIYIFTRTYVLQNVNEITRYVFSIVLIFILSHISYKYVETRYRKIGRQPVNSFDSLKLTFYFVLIPLFLLGALRLGSTHYYWKVNSPNIQGTIECANIGENDECESGNIQSDDVFVLIGDSHAAAISQSFANAASSVGAKAVFFSGRGCQILGFRKDQEFYPNETCRTYTYRMTQYLKSHNVNRVFVMQRSSSIQETVPSKEYLSNILEGLIAIKDQTTHLTVIGPNPEYRVGFGQGTIKELFEGVGWQKRRYLLSNSFSDDSYYEKNLERFDIDYLRTTDIFCDKVRCQFLDHKGYLYWDNNHLSLSGADRLTKMLASEFAKDVKN